jgi:hypothetical protein
MGLGIQALSQIDNRIEHACFPRLLDYQESLIDQSQQITTSSSVRNAVGSLVRVDSDTDIRSSQRMRDKCLLPMIKGSNTARLSVERPNLGSLSVNIDMKLIDRPTYRLEVIENEIGQIIVICFSHQKGLRILRRSTPENA